MTKIDNFKSFVRRNPNLTTYVREKNTSWQEFYELYDFSVQRVTCLEMYNLLLFALSYLSMYLFIEMLLLYIEIGRAHV